jgi:hypothetical protein
MIVMCHLKNSRSQSVPWLVEELGLQVHPAYLSAVARRAYALAGTKAGVRLHRIPRSHPRPAWHCRTRRTAP